MASGPPPRPPGSMSAPSTSAGRGPGGRYGGGGGGRSKPEYDRDSRDRDRGGPSNDPRGSYRQRSISPQRRGNDRKYSEDGKSPRGAVVRRQSRYSPSPPPRRSSPSPPRASVYKTLDEFTKALQAVMSSLSKREIATRALHRLEEFQVNEDALADAIRKVTETEKALTYETNAFQDSFMKLLSTALRRPGMRDGDVSQLQLEELRDRLNALEDRPPQQRRAITAGDESHMKPRLGLEARPPPEPFEPPPPPPPPEPDVSAPPSPPPQPKSEVPTREGSTAAPSAVDEDRPQSPGSKRSRARALLHSVLERLETTEGKMDEMINRCDDFEDQIASRDIEAHEMIDDYKEMVERTTQLSRQYRALLRRAGGVEPPLDGEPSAAAPVVKAVKAPVSAPATAEETAINDHTSTTAAAGVVTATASAPATAEETAINDTTSTPTQIVTRPAPHMPPTASGDLLILVSQIQSQIVSLQQEVMTLKANAANATPPQNVEQIRAALLPDLALIKADIQKSVAHGIGQSVGQLLEKERARTQQLFTAVVDDAHQVAARAAADAVLLASANTNATFAAADNNNDLSDSRNPSNTAAPRQVSHNGSATASPMTLAEFVVPFQPSGTLSSSSNHPIIPTPFPASPRVESPQHTASPGVPTFQQHGMRHMTSSPLSPRQHHQSQMGMDMMSMLQQQEVQQDVQQHQQQQHQQQKQQHQQHHAQQYYPPAQPQQQQQQQQTTYYAPHRM